MGIREDQDEFNTSGLRGLLGQLMRTKNEAFIRVFEGGWRGEEVAQRPEPGSGPYIHFKRGEPVMEFSNASVTDTTSREFRVEV